MSILCHLALLLPLVQDAPVPEPVQGPLLRVVTYNVRYGTADDGENRWELRRAHLMETVQDLAPDLLGVQEALDFQLAALEEDLDRYDVLGVGREADGGGEHAALLYDRARFEVERHGDFWLSPTPEAPGSVGWDAALPRICTWAVLRDRASGARLAWWNAHFDHRGEEARTESARLLVRRLAEHPGLPHLVTGDFNAGEDSAALAALRAAGLRDTFRVLHPSEERAGTFGGFVGRADGPKIDYVLVSPELEVLEARIDRRSFDGRDPSDHFPVLAVLRLPAGSGDR